MAVKIKITSDYTFSYSEHLNRTPFIKEISIINEGDYSTNELDLKMHSKPSFFEVYVGKIPPLAKGEKYIISNVKLEYDAGELANYTEKVKGTLCLELFDGLESICEEKFEVELRPFDEMSNYSRDESLRAAFVTPNHPKIKKLVSLVSDIKGTKFDSYSVVGYQWGREEVIKTAKCIYEAIVQQEIAYVNTMPSYNAGWQRVRLVDEILEDKQGNCLDLTCLFASVLEAVGFNPLIVITFTHAYVGFWTKDKCLDKPAYLENEFIYQTLNENKTDIVLIECTLSTKGKNADYDYAVNYAYDNNLKKIDLAALVDVKAARKAGILPIPSRRTEEPEEQEEELVPFTYPPVDEGETEEKPEDTLDEEDEEEEMEEVPAPAPDKVTRWKNKLLDLTAGSDLLNIKITAEGKRAARLPETDIFDLYEKVKSGYLYAVLGDRKDSNERKEDLEKRILHTNYTDEATKKLLSYMYTKDRDFRDQKGAGILYLALGCLHWNEKKSGKWYDAPLLMLPMVFKKEGQDLKLYFDGSDIHLNAAVLEMVKARFNLQPAGVNPEPSGADGRPDLKVILKKLRSAFKEEKGMEVQEIAHLGIFSFAQYMMWNDLDKNEEFYLSHPIVHSIEQGQKDSKIDEDAFAFDENAVFLPIAADGAQIEAMTAALGNRSFVLHGPPGTGKSQTITGMLANFIGHGRTVLFAAEKAAALQVVYNRMKNIGLDPFCLYLPVDSASRSTMDRFLTQYRNLMEKAEAEGTEYEEICEKIKREKEKLEKQLALFVETEFAGYTLKELVGNVLNNTERLIPVASIDEKLMEQIREEKLKDLEELLKNTIHMGELAGGAKDHPLKGMGSFEYRFGMQKDLRNVLYEYQELLTQISLFNARLTYNKKEDEKDYIYVSDLEYCQKLLDLYEIPEKLRKTEDLIKKLTIWLGWLDVQDEKKEIYKVLEPGIEALDLKRMANKWKSIKNSTTAEAKLQKLILKDELCKYILKENPSDRYITEMFISALKLKQLNEETPASPGFNLSLSRQQTEELRSFLENHFPDGIPEEAKKLTDEDKTNLTNLLEALKEKEVLESRLKNLFGAEVPVWEPGMTAAETIDRIGKWMEGLDKLREWSDYQKLTASCTEKGLKPWIDLYETGIDVDKILADFLSYSCEAMLREIYETNDLVKEFAGFRFDNMVDKFAELMDGFHDICAKEIRYRHLVNIREVLADAENEKNKVALKKIIEANGKGITIREIMERIGGFILKLTPCVMATPMTTSMYFPVEAVTFDHMLLDEASQLQTCKSIGLIVRSKHSIIVGDPNQMPPTSFFESTAPDYNLDVLEEDQESILKDFIALDMPDYYLRWHYRSHHESLIAFSNRNYYGGRMITFPAANKTSKVHVVRTNGIYDRGSTITNPIEAGVLVDYLEKMVAGGDTRSFGIVAFNKRQQTLIEQLIEKRVEENEDFAKGVERMKENGEELFVRNLESVQGDERDVIFFSVGYGPDKDGKILMAFGPLGKAGGWRRLNVAITRARDEMILFTSMDSEQMNLTEATSRGVKDLKNFIAYAEGKDVFGQEETAEQVEQKVEGFADAVCKYLEKAGYTYTRDVGNSSLKIDIGVHDKESDSYLLGIMLNSNGGKGEFTIYDSEVGQNRILKAQGWNILRIWSLDWFEDSEREMKRIMDRIKEQENVKDGQ